MKITKEAHAIEQQNVTDAELEKINLYTGRKLNADEVFVFSIKLCDNEKDRDSECFSQKCLEELAELFVGKTGISDHNWSSDRQIARIFDTEVLTEEGRFTALGEPYTYVKARAYTLKTAGNEELIARISGGINKEVSVGCAVSECICSICGNPLGSVECGHIRGGEYNGECCIGILNGATDAYEWSFVAVPAQIDAGVIKGHFKSRAKTLKELAEESGRAEFVKELDTLSKQAEAGRRYLDKLAKDALRLGAITKLWEPESLGSVIKNMDEKALLSLITSLEAKADELYPPETQLMAYKKEKAEPEFEYLI